VLNEIDSAELLSALRKGVQRSNQLNRPDNRISRWARDHGEINDALKQEYARREAAVKNLYRLRALRLARDRETKAK
jgi:hypothetical protein